MTVLTFKKQQELYKRIVNVIVTLASVTSINDMDEMELNYAISDMLYIARTVGGKRMIEALEVKKKC